MGFTFEHSSAEVEASTSNKMYKVITIKNKKNRRELSKLLKFIQFNSYLKVKLTTFPRINDYKKYQFYDPYNTIRIDIVETVRRLSMDGYLVVAEVSTII